MAFDAFLKIAGIQGESADGTIPIESFSWGVTGPREAQTGSGLGKPVFTDLTIVKLVDSTSPKLLQLAVDGKFLPAVQLTCRKAGGQQEFAFYKITGVLIALLRDAGNRHGGEFPTEEVSFNFHNLDMKVGFGKF